MADRPKLLVTASTFPRWVGDTEPSFVESLSFELARFFDVVVLVPRTRGAARHETLLRDGRRIEVHRFRYFLAPFESLAYDGGILSRVRANPLRVLLVPFFLLGQYIAAARLHKLWRFDAIHAHWLIPQGVVAAVLRSRLRRSPPLLVTSHGGDLYALQGKLLERLKSWVLARADAITVVSNAMREQCEDLGVDAGRIAVQSMGVDLKSTFTQGNARHARQGLVFVGRLVDKKGLTYLIDAMRILARRRPDLRLTVVGDGPLRTSLEQQVSEFGLEDQVEFVGSVPNDAVPDYLRAAAISVMPSVVAPSGDQEGLGLVAVEALGCGCAVVASDLPAVRDTIIDGETGLMARPEDGEDLAEKVARLLDDDALRLTLAEAGRAYALERFDWRSVGANYARIIEGMIQKSR